MGDTFYYDKNKDVSSVDFTSLMLIKRIISLSSSIRYYYANKTNDKE